MFCDITSLKQSTLPNQPFFGGLGASCDRPFRYRCFFRWSVPATRFLCANSLCLSINRLTGCDTFFSPQKKRNEQKEDTEDRIRPRANHNQGAESQSKENRADKCFCFSYTGHADSHIAKITNALYQTANAARTPQSLQEFNGTKKIANIKKKRERRSSYHAWEKGLQAPSRSSTATYTAEKNLKTAKNKVEKMQSSRVTVQERKNNPWNKRERSEEVKRSESRENKKTPRESKPKTSKCVTLRRRKR